MNETAVKWLKQKTSHMTIDKTNYIISEWQDGYDVALEDVIKLLNQALELEKQQIIDAYQWGRTDQDSKESKWYNRNAKKYYSETYKNEAE